MSPRRINTPLPSLARLMIVGMICLSLGLHWALLQGIAWTGMILSFASKGTVIEAVQKTFDGRHGCALCQKVKEAQKPENQEPRQTGRSVKKFEAVLVALPCLVPPAAEEMSFAKIRESCVTRNEKPEMPPPRRWQA